MTDEIWSMAENNTWKLVPLPQGAKAIDCKWIFKIKEPSNPNDEPKFKARFVAKRFLKEKALIIQKFLLQ